MLEGWYEHKLFNGEVSALFGLHDYNSDFYALDYASTLVNSSFGIGVDATQIGVSVYPVTALGTRVKYNPNDNFYLQGALYDGVPGDPEHTHGTRVKFDSGDGAFYAYELGTVASEEESKTAYYKLALGGWFHTAKFETYAGEEKKRNFGYYFIGESSILREDDDAQGLGVFAQFGYADPNKNQTGFYFGSGFQYVGAVPTRDEDILSFGLAHARNSQRFTNLNEGFERAETALEVSYIVSVTPYLSLQPDLQYIVNPGTDKALDNAFVGIFRTQVAF